MIFMMKFWSVSVNFSTYFICLVGSYKMDFLFWAPIIALNIYVHVLQRKEGLSLVVLMSNY
jgi:hypothetical protein